MRSRGCCPERWGMQIPPRRTRSPMACSTARTTPDPRCTRVEVFRRCCSAATTNTSGAGVCSSPWGVPGNAEPIFWIVARFLEKRRSCWTTISVSRTIVNVSMANCGLSLERNMSNKNLIIQQIEAEQMNKEIPAFAPGDTVIVQVKVKEGDRQRLQAFEGVVIGKRSRGLNSAFTVRKISNGVGVERTFQTYSPLVDSISVKRRGDVRKAKLYYLRELSGKAARIKEKLA